MQLTQALLVCGFAAGSLAASAPGPRSENRIGRFTLPLQRRNIAARSRGDEAVATIYDGTDWVTSANFGGQDLRVQIDTGSADLWVVSTLLPQDFISTNLSANKLYDPKKSSSWKPIDGQIFNITYDVGELGASGPVGTETVNIGGATVTGMVVGAATTLFGQGIIDPTYDGTLGLGWQIQNTEVSTEGKPNPAPTFMEAIQDQLDDPIFTADFNAKHAESLSFGFVNSALYTGQLTKLPVNNETSFWSIDGVTFSSGNTNLGNGTGFNILMDTGGVGTTTDEQTANDYWQLVQGASQDDNGYWLYPCDTSTLPDLTMNFPSGGSATIKGAVLNESSQDLGDNTCVGGVQFTQNGFPNAGFGFFASYFTVWNQEEPSLSFAPYSDVDDTAAQNPGDLPTSGGTSGTQSTSSSKALAAPTAGPALGYGVGLGAVAAGLMVAL